MPPLHIPGRTSHWTSVTGESWIKWKETSQVGRDPKTQGMRVKRRKTERSPGLQKLCDVPGALMCTDGNHVFASHYTSKWQDNGNSLPASKVTALFNRWAKEGQTDLSPGQRSLHDPCLYSAKSRTQYAMTMTSQPYLVGETVTT